MSITIRKQYMYLPVLDEDIVDFGIGTPAEQEAAAARIEARRAASRASWLARPLWQRAWIRLRYSSRWYEARHRLDHVARAIRGIECEP
jgi:hypothetical protein